MKALKGENRRRTYGPFPGVPGPVAEQVQDCQEEFLERYLTCVGKLLCIGGTGNGIMSHCLFC
jgi:hypothetical protein